MEPLLCPRKCINYTGDLKCLAFPEGIPEEILLGKVGHKEPYDGDHGIQFELVDGGEHD